MIEIECPGCGREVWLEELDQSSDEFCEHCDAPLFFARPSRVAGEAGQTGEVGLGRRPGFDGRRVALAQRCHSCGEPNKADATYCRRCGNEMHTAPPPLSRPEPLAEEPPRPLSPPPPPPSDPIPSRDSLLWIALQVTLLTLLVIVAVGVLLARSVS